VLGPTCKTCEKIRKTSTLYNVLVFAHGMDFYNAIIVLKSMQFCSNRLSFYSLHLLLFFNVLPFSVGLNHFAQNFVRLVSFLDSQQSFAFPNLSATVNFLQHRRFCLFELYTAMLHLHQLCPTTRGANRNTNLTNGKL